LEAFNLILFYRLTKTIFTLSDMSVLDKETFFSGADPVGTNDLGKVKVGNFATDIDDLLKTHFGWRGKAIAVIGLSLSPDNLRVNAGTLVMRGNLELKEKKMQANTIWAAARPNIMLHFQFPNADVFRFSEGGLWSELVPASMLTYTFHDSTEGQGGRALLSADERLEGTEPGFCIRIVAQVSSISSASKGVILRAAIMLFPSNAEDTMEATESRFAGWPGLKIGEVVMPLGPCPTSQWKCPVLPFLRPMTPFETNDYAPSSDKLRAAIAAVMRNAKIHDGLKSGEDVLSKWAAIRSNPRTMIDAAPSITWPHPDRPEEEDLSGK
jgi:hypothetical protein